jgi:hypothetical protein
MKESFENEAKVQYGIISKLSFSQILDMISSGCENPISPYTLKQGDTVVYAEGFDIRRIEGVLNGVEGGLGDRTVRQLSLFIVSNIKLGADGVANGMQYMMYHIKFVGDTLFKELYASHDPLLKEYNKRAMLERIDRPTIVFNVITGEKWICDWTHPRYSEGGLVKMPEIKFHTGSSAVFGVSQIVILNPPTLSDDFLNWLNVNPFEVKQ